MTVAEKLRQLRDAAGVTQEQMAERSGIKPVDDSRLRAGTARAELEGSFPAGQSP